MRGVTNSALKWCHQLPAREDGDVGIFPDQRFSGRFCQRPGKCSAASDPNYDSLTYNWRATNGSINGSGTSATWNRVIEFGRVRAGDVTVVVNGGRGEDTAPC
ncbi:MAG: hypothetical protein U0401_23555 [Anaerolineae bacterium]